MSRFTTWAGSKKLPENVNNIHIQYEHVLVQQVIIRDTDFDELINFFIDQKSFDFQLLGLIYIYQMFVLFILKIKFFKDNSQICNWNTT